MTRRAMSVERTFRTWLPMLVANDRAVGDGFVYRVLERSPLRPEPHRAPAERALEHLVGPSVPAAVSSRPLREKEPVPT